MLLKSKDKLYIISGVLIVIFACFIAFFIYPTLTDVIGHSQKLLADKAQDSLMQKELSELQAFKNNEYLYDANLQKADNLLIDARNPVDFVEFLERIAGQSQISVDVSLAPQVSGKPVPFVLNTTGSFSGTAAFSRRVETGPYLITINKLSITKPEFSKEDPHYVAGQVKSVFFIDVAAQTH
jgi:hypothetical protein